MAEKLDLDALAIAMYGAAIRYKKGEVVDFQNEAREFMLERASQPGSGEAEYERAAFHSFVNGAGGHTMRRADGSYASSMTELWWKCWKARASLDGRREGNE